jgi:outer membrane protein
MKKQLFGLFLLTATMSAMAQYTLKFGYSTVAPHSTASAISGPLTPVNSLSLQVQDKSTLFLSISRSITDNIDAELALGLPPTHDVAIKIINPALPAGLQAFDGQIGARVRQVAPTAFINYKFGEKKSTLRPFVGIGINYTKFDKATSTAAGNAINGGATNIALEDSVGLAWQLGASYQINDQWSLSGAWASAKVRTTITTNTLGTVRTADIKFRPSVFTLSMGYAF